MKVGIISMQRVCNNGSFLQAYGLKKLIESLGHEVLFLDYEVGEPVMRSWADKKTYMLLRVRNAFIRMFVKCKILRRILSIR